VNRLISGIALIVALAGCSSLYEPKPHITLLKDDAVLSNSAALSNTFILDRKTPFVTCSQGQPDAGFNQAEEGDLSISLISFGGGSDSGAAAETSSESELIGRTPTVLITRELFFRLCEFSRNYGLDKKEAKELYQTTLETVKSVWSTEAGNTSVKLGKTLSISDVEKILGALPALPGTKPPAQTPGPQTPSADYCAQNPGASGC